jgi:hypothetical protein
MAATNGDLAAPAKKYTGQLKIESGPVPLQRWGDKSRPSEAKGDSMRAERQGKVGSHPT